MNALPNHGLKLSPISVDDRSRNFFRWSAVLCLGLLFLSAQPASANDALGFFKNYFVTGDYVVGGVGIRGTGVLDTKTQGITQSSDSFYATGTIHMNGVPGYVANGVPQQADIVAAYLYWETIATSTADPTVLAQGTFRGLKIVGTQIAAAGTLACSGSGGGNGNQTGAQTLFVYRADVLRYLPYKHDQATGQPLGQRLVNDADLIANGFPLHTVSLPDTGAGGTTSPSTGNQAFLTEGASLVVVYRVAGPSASAPLKSVVIYDGGYTFSSTNPLMTQNLLGFYQASTSSLAAKMTHIVGNGRSNFQEQMTVNGLVPTGVSTNNPFPGALGSSWDNLTFSVSNLMSGNDASISTKVTPGDPASTACLSWGAVVFSTTVQDSDGDGLLDIWETTSGLTDPHGQTLPDLHGMGADPNVRDIFVEVDYMSTIGYNTTIQGVVPAHSHLPTLASLQKVAAAFSAQNLPIKVHFDVGNNYQPTSTSTPVSPRPDYIIPANLAFGGDSINEASCGAIQTPTCLFPDYPGTLSWKTGFGPIKNTYFSHNRKDTFHYALFGHALGLPKWRTSDKSLSGIVVSSGLATATTQLAHGLTSSALVTVFGASAASGLNGTYLASRVTDTTFTFSTAATPGIYQNFALAISNGTPRSNSGVSDIGGGDLMVTLGLWDNSVGTDFMQASTLFHELGHNLDLGHGGDISDPLNCKPNYQSSMSYLFQVRGLLDPNGFPHIDYSHVALPLLNETNLSESPSGLGTAPLAYLPRWYAPRSSFLDAFIGTTPATKHCDGTPITDGAQMVRVDGTTLTPTPLDWNEDGNTSESGLSQDINFDGTTITNPPSPAFQGFDDWDNLNLQQVGARRGASGTSLDVGPGQDSGDDLGIAGGGLGIAGGGLGIADGDFGIAGGELGIAGGGLGIAGGGLGIAGGGLGGELDFDTAKSLGNAPNALAAAVVGLNIDLAWTPPNVDVKNVDHYTVWRITCPKNSTLATCTVSPSEVPVQVGTPTPATPLCDSGFNFCDTTTKNNVLYLYFVTATTTGHQNSGPSNQVKKSR